ncbi:MAG: RHS repeat-associated core domain-containing protein [Thermodesulfobacteriota bacterium]
MLALVNLVFLFSLTGFNCRAAAQDLPQVRHSVKPLNLSRAPTTEELMAAGQLGGPLYPTHFLANKAREREVNHSFGVAIQAWNMHEYQEAVEMFRQHVAQYPDSPWASEAVLHVGCDALYHGRYTEAGNCFNRILAANRDSQHQGARIMVHKARTRLANLKTLQGNFPAAQEQFRLLKQDSQDWRDRTYAAHWIQRLSREKRDQLAIFNCGAQALAHLLRKKGQKSQARDLQKLVAASSRGHSMRDLKSLAASQGYRLTGLKLTVAQLRQIPLPAIVQLTGRTQGDRGHYWVLEAVEKNALQFFDPQSGNRFRQTEAEFAREWGGNALVFAGPHGLPGLKLAAKEMSDLYGGCCGVPRAPSNLGKPDNKQKGCGSPVWSVNPINLNFFVTDTPLWYRSPIGPGVEITLNYNSQASIAQYEPFGNKWAFNYGCYLVEDTGGTVTVFMGDGRNDIFTPDGAGGFTPPTQVFNRLDKLSAYHYELRFPDDSVYTFNIPAGTTSLQPFLVEIRDAHGLKLTFGYDAAVRLTTITDAVGRVTNLTYNANNLVTQVTDPFGRTAAFDYDANKNLVKITDMGNYAASFTYDQDIFMTSIAKDRGVWNIYTEPADGIPNGSNGYPAPGGTMWEDFRVTVTDPFGNKEEYHYDGNLIYGWYVSPNNYVNYVSYEASNVNTPKTRYYYITSNYQGYIASKRLPLSDGYYFGYDSYGNRTYVSDYHGYKSYTYNNMSLPTSITASLSYTANMTYASNNVDLISTQDDLGQIKLTYNNTHEVTSLTDRLGNVTTFAYNDYGQLISSTDAAGAVTNYLYDAYHRLVEVRQGRHRTRAAQRVQSYTYDALDRVRTYTDATGLTVTYDYNDLDQATRITYPDGKFRSFQYSTCCPRLLDQVTERSGQATFYTYDKLNRLTAVTDPASGMTRFAYDANGNRTQLVDPKGNVTRFKYDAGDRLVKKIYADGEYELYTYNNYGLVASKRNARGITTYYNYDANNNLTRIYYNTYYYQDTLPWINYTYDKYNRLLSSSNAVGTYTYEYDANSRLVSVDGPWDNDKITYQYDALGRRIAMTREKGQAAAYAYDEYNRLTAVNAGGDLYYYTYTGVNPLVRSLTRPNGARTTFQYDALQRLTQMTTKNIAGVLINSYSYTFNAQDLRAAETANEPVVPTPYQNAAVQYAYNNVNQLLSATDPGTKTFAHDRDGNLEKGYTPDGYAFTALYDPENRLQSLTHTGADGAWNKTEYYYLGEMLVQVKKYRNSSLVSDSRYVYDGALLVQERDADNNITREYTWGHHKGGGIGGLLHLNQEGANYSYLYDGKGNVSAVLNSAGGVSAAYQYDPFGRRRAQSGSLSQLMQFSTKPYDDQTGMSYYGYRFYASAVGRWMTRDPLKETGGKNLYAFVKNNPVEYIDPVGLVNWEQAGRSFGGLVGNAFAVAGGAIIATGTAVTGVGLVAGTALVFTGSYGVTVNATNLWAALFEKNPASKGSFFNDVADLAFPNSYTAQNLATAADLSLGLVGGRLSPNLWVENIDNLLGTLDVVSAADDLLQAYTDPEFLNAFRDLTKKGVCPK